MEHPLGSYWLHWEDIDVSVYERGGLWASREEERNIVKVKWISVACESVAMGIVTTDIHMATLTFIWQHRVTC